MESGILNEAFLHDDEFGDAKKSDRFTLFNSFINYKNISLVAVYPILFSKYHWITTENLRW